MSSDSKGDITSSSAVYEASSSPTRETSATRETREIKAVTMDNTNNELNHSVLSDTGSGNGSSSGIGGGHNEKENEYGMECDYDVNPTKLYITIQRKKWAEAEDLILTHPDQTKVWVSRKEDRDRDKTPKNSKGIKLRWRLLPLHAAIIFKAPTSTILALLTAYPRACCYKDDQGMLPIHLAIRNESSEAIVTMLLVAFPQCTQIGDRKNRTAMHVAQISKSMLKDQYIQALHNYKAYCDVAAASQIAFSMYEAKNNPTTNLQNTANVQKLSLMGKVDSLEMELARSRDENQLLVDHIQSVKSQLTSSTDAEDFYVQKIANFEDEIKELQKEKEMLEVQYKREVETNTNTVEELESDLKAYQTEIELHKQINNEKDRSMEIAAETTFIHTHDRNQLEEKAKLLEVENASILANAAVLETQLKKKIQNEHSLATQVSDLASKLSESALMSSELTNSHQNRIESFQKERIEMKHSYDNVSRNLKHAMTTMEEMCKENNRMLHLSRNQEKIIADMNKQQQELASHAARHEQSLIDAAWEREEIVKILARQAEDVEKTSTDTRMIMKVVKDNNSHIASTAGERAQLVESISKQKGLMDSLKHEVNELYQTVNNEVDGISISGTSTYSHSSSVQSSSSVQCEKENEGDMCNKRQSQQQVEYMIHKDKSSRLRSNDEISSIQINASGSVEMLPNLYALSSVSTETLQNMSTISSNSSAEEEDEFQEEKCGHTVASVEEVQVEENEEEEFEEEFKEEKQETQALADLSMNMKNISVNFGNQSSIDVADSSVDNLCKEAAALIASIPTPTKLTN